MKILFLTEYGEGVGYGHLSRCTALADGFSEYDCEITMISSGGRSNFKPNRGFDFINKEWKNKTFLKNYLQDHDITVTDSYRANYSILRYIGEQSHLPVYLVDSTMNFYPAGVILFPSVYADNINLEEYGEIEVIAGREYLLFTKEFWNVNKKEITNSLKHLGVSLGGIADKKITDVLSQVHQSLPELNKVSVFGNLDDDLIGEIDGDKIVAKGFMKKSEYVEALLQQDAMICNGGQTLNESLLLGLPALSLVCADNQKKNANYWEQAGFSMNVDVRNHINKRELNNKLKKLATFSFRKKVNRKSVDLIDSDGAIKAAKKLLEIAFEKRNR